MVFRWPIYKIDGLPINSMVIFHGYVKSPDGNYIYIYVSACVYTLSLGPRSRTPGQIWSNYFSFDMGMSENGVYPQL